MTLKLLLVMTENFNLSLFKLKFQLVPGHLALLLGDYTLAQNLYLQSNSPIEALNMRRDLLQWDQVCLYSLVPLNYKHFDQCP